MEPEQISQIIESIKTLNINFNDATTQKLADVILPVVKMFIIQRYVGMFLDLMGLVFLVVFIGTLVYKIVKREQEINLKKYS